MAPRTKKHVPRRKAKKVRVNSSIQLIKDNYATLSETLEVPFPDPFYGFTNVMYNLTHSLASYSRAIEVARNYQEFQISYVEVRVKPRFDTYTNVPGGNTAAPQLYYQVIKDGDTPTTALELKHNGINPVPFSMDKNISWRYKPAVVIAGSAGNPTILRVSPWLNTNNNVGAGYTANDTKHYGTALIADTLDAVSEGMFRVEVETHFKFRKPSWVTPTPPAPSVLMDV